MRPRPCARGFVAGAAACAFATGHAAAEEPAPTHRARTATPAATAPAPRLVTREQVTLRTRDVAGAISALLARAREAGWRLQEREDERVVLRLPPEQLLAARLALRDLGTEIEHESLTQDVTGALAELEARERSATAARARLLTLQGPGRSVTEMVQLTRAVEVADDALASATRERQRLEREVAEATLAVTFVPALPPEQEAIPAVRLPFPWLERTHEDALYDRGAPSEPGRSGEGREPRRRRRSIEAFPEASMLLEVARLPDRPHPDESAWMLGGALRTRALVGTKPVGLAMGFDVGLAGGEGFAHDLDLLGGIAGAVNSWLAFGVLSGPAGRAWTGGRVPAAWEIPLELATALDFGHEGRFLLQVRPQWIPRDTSTRRDGSSLGFADELLVRATLATAVVSPDEDVEEGGLRLGFAYHELMGTHMVTFCVGWGVGETDHRYRD